MKVIISGSRFWSYYEAFVLALTMMEVEYEEDITFIVAGENPNGVDAMAKRYYEERSNKLDYKGHEADWTRYGKSAGPKRNIEMLEAHPDADLVICFWDGRKKKCGTYHMMTEAAKRGFKVETLNVKSEFTG